MRSRIYGNNVYAVMVALDLCCVASVSGTELIDNNSMLLYFINSHHILPFDLTKEYLLVPLCPGFCSKIFFQLFFAIQRLILQRKSSSCNSYCIYTISFVDHKTITLDIIYLFLFYVCA